jgi:hypothetical protein
MADVTKHDLGNFTWSEPTTGFTKYRKGTLALFPRLERGFPSVNAGGLDALHVPFRVHVAQQRLGRMYNRFKITDFLPKGDETLE